MTGGITRPGDIRVNLDNQQVIETEENVVSYSSSGLLGRLKAPTADTGPTRVRIHLRWAGKDSDISG